jgi:putative acetyltransferase
MTAAAAARDELRIAQEDPREGDALILYDEMQAFTDRTYPEDASLGIFPSTPEEVAREGVFVVARLGGKAVGTGALMPLGVVEDRQAMEVKRMYVREEARGRRIAEQILRWLEIIARTRGAQQLMLLCGPRQPEALRLYERCGFVRRSAFGAYTENSLSIFFEKHL